MEQKKSAHYNINENVKIVTETNNERHSSRSPPPPPLSLLIVKGYGAILSPHFGSKHPLR